MPMIAQYYAKAGIHVDMAQLKKVDRYLSMVEAKFRNFHKRQQAAVLNINFKFNTKRLQFFVQKAFDDVSRRMSFPVNRFDINRTALNSAVRTAMASANATLRINPRVSQVPQGRPLPNQQGITGRHAAFAGGAAGMFGRYGAPAIIGGTALYGLASLNKANQDLISANISAESVLGANAKPLLDRLSERSNYLGVSYKDTLPQFTKFMASSIPLMGVDTSQKTFESFLQFGRTRGADKVSMNRALTAVGQMSAKGQVMAEELKNQLGDASGFGELPQLFAEAFQIKTGGKLTGAEARASLMKQMELGNVVTSDILPIVSKLMDELSKGGIEKARKSSVAEQLRAENLLLGRNGLLQQFSEQGGEEGYARIFRTFTDGLSQASGLVKSLASGFNEVTKSARDLLLIPQSFSRMLQGKDSLIADKFFPSAEDRAVAIAWMESFKTATSELSDFTGMVYQGWKDIFSLLEASTVLAKLTAMNETLSNAFGFVNALGKGDTAAMGKTATGFGNAAGSVLESLPLVGPAVRAYNATDDKFKPTTWTERFLSDAKNNAYAARDQRVQEMSQLAGGRQGGIVMRDINVEITGADFTGQNPSEAAQQLADKIVQQAKEQILGEAWQMYPQTQ